jgi:hypothetical protein
LATASSLSADLASSATAKFSFANLTRPTKVSRGRTTPCAVCTCVGVYVGGGGVVPNSHRASDARSDAQHCNHLLAAHGVLVGFCVLLPVVCCWCCLMLKLLVCVLSPTPAILWLSAWGDRAERGFARDTAKTRNCARRACGRPLSRRAQQQKEDRGVGLGE